MKATMIKLGITALLLFAISGAHAQTFREWFRQKRTQREYLLQQIAALRVYSGYLKRGYDIVKDGTGAISEFTGGEFGLHRDYFTRLKEVDPALLRSGKVESVITLHTEMERQRLQAWRQVNGSDHLSMDEKQYIRKFLDGLGHGSDTELEEMLIVVTAGRLDLSDDERIKRIDTIYRNAQKLYTIHQNSLPALIAMMEGRKRETAEVELLRKMYGVGQ